MLANNIMNALWVEDLDIDNEDVLINILKKIELNVEDIIREQRIRNVQIL